MTYIFMAVHYPLAGTSDQVYGRMSGMAESMAGTPGLLEIGPWLDREGQRVIGLSRWVSREAFEKASLGAACPTRTSTTVRAARASTSTSSSRTEPLARRRPGYRQAGSVWRCPPGVPETQAGAAVMRS